MNFFVKMVQKCVLKNTKFFSEKIQGNIKLFEIKNIIFTATQVFYMPQFCPRQHSFVSTIHTWAVPAILSNSAQF